MTHYDRAGELVVPTLFASVDCHPEGCNSQWEWGDEVAQMAADELGGGGLFPGFRVHVLALIANLAILPGVA